MSIYDRISAERLSLLERLLGRCASNEVLGRRAARFILCGTDEGVLGEIENSAARGRWNLAGQALPYPNSEEVHKLLIFLVALEQPPLLVRLARVYRAAEVGSHAPTLGIGLGTPLWPEAPWLDTWLRELGTYGYKPIVTCGLLVAMLESEGLAGELLVRPALQMKRGARTFEDGQAQMASKHLAKTGDYGALLAQYPALIREFLRTAAAPDKIPVLQLLRDTKCDPQPFRAELLELATASAKTVRDAAEPLLRAIKDSVRTDLERICKEGGGPVRGQAFELMPKLFFGPSADAFLRQFEGANLPKPVRTGLERALAMAGSIPPPAAAVADAEPVRTRVQLSAEAKETFRGVVAAHNLVLAQDRPLRKHLTGVRDLEEADIQTRILLLETLEKPAPDLPGVFRLSLPAMKDAAHAFVDAPGIELIHVVRLLLLTGDLRNTEQLGGYYSFVPPAGEIADRFRRRKRFSLLELASVLRAIAVDDRSIAYSMAERAGPFLHWPSDMVAPYLLQHIDVLESFLRVRPSPPWQFAADGVFRMLEHLPEVPPQLLPKLWDLATGEADGERALAKGILSKLPDLDSRLSKALRGGNASARANAAHWLVDRECRAAAPAILEAFHREKQEATKDALLVALERFGTPIDTLLDRHRLLVECQAIAARGVPPSLAWFPLAQLPEVHWEDTGARVEQDILTGLLIRTCKLATPQPGPLLRRYCALWRAEDRKALGEFILNEWIARDVGDNVPGGPVHTMSTSQSSAQSSQLFAQAMQAMAQPALLQQLMATALSQMKLVPAAPPNPASSAIKEKGILALAAACRGQSAVTTVSQYLKKWYGYRAAQCRALLGILPWLDSPAATQLLLATARRFRTAGIREEAETLCLDLAARRHWTMDQLGDRTIPTAGFDDGPDCEVNLGGRTLLLSLTPQLTVELRSGEGKVFKDFPAQAKSDDEALYAQAKETFAETRKSLRNIVKQQTERLYEAMCVERTWRFAELRELLFEHPIVGRLCQRLVWEAVATPPETFRPMDDKTLTNARDSQVDLGPEVQVRIAYGPADAVEWLRHLADYEVAPLFPQLDRPIHQPSEDDADALRAFEGHSVEFFTLRSLAAKFGYQHGALDDGPFFSTYTKRLGGLSLNVELEFSGMDMPGENRPVVLTETRFMRGMEQLPLSKVPRVLLSECWHDLRAIAAAGTGYDPDLKEKVPF